MSIHRMLRVTEEINQAEERGDVSESSGPAGPVTPGWVPDRDDLSDALMDLADRAKAPNP